MLNVSNYWFSETREGHEGVGHEGEGHEGGGHEGEGHEGVKDTWTHAYSMREFNLIRCVNSRLYEAWINTCTKCEVMSDDSEDLAFLNHDISRDQNISCNHSPLPRPGCD